MSHKLTIMGCGSSGGVPRIGNQWGACDPANPRNRRRRCAVLIERFGPRGRTKIVIDTPPDLREQLLEARVGTVDAVFYTHDHADHTHGIDDLRVLAFNAKRRVDVYFDKATGDIIRSRFDYCFRTKPGSSYSPILNGRELQPGEPVTITGPGGPVTLLPILQEHGEIASLGYRIGDVCYSPDIVGIPAASRPLMDGLDVWIVDALRPQPHPSHYSVAQALEAIKDLKPKRAILTHLHVDLDYETLSRSLPEGVEAAYDGLSVEFQAR